MAALFWPAFELVMSWEDPGKSGKVTKDSGGITRYGISTKAYPKVDVAKLSLTDASEIYRNDYWKPIKGYEIDDQGVANKLLDMAVNMGVHQAVTLCQRSLCTLGLLVAIDGAIGPNTIEAINKANPESLLGLLRVFAKQFYVDLANKKPELEKYLKGWIRRAES